MKKQLLSILLVMLAFVSFGQQWVAINGNAPSTIQTTLVSSSERQVTVNLQVPGFYATEVTTPQGEANIISVPKTVSTAAAGEPNLPMIAIPAIIGDRLHYSVRVIDAQYTDFQMEVAPSKGDFPRTINPADVPYTYGEAYSTDAFFPAQNAGLYEPYILRDFRGQNMAAYPFAYNPVTHTLRVYYNMTIEMFSDGLSNENVFDRRSNTVKMDPEFDAIYTRQFINYQESLTKYTPMIETGELLIICYDSFMSEMEPFVNWKKQIGRPTTMVGTSTAGTTSSAIKSYIQNQYNANNNITHVLLVGDVAQIPGNSYSAGSYGGYSDNMYGQITGNDFYNEIIIGRFSAENTTHVATQVNKVIYYERDINATATWLTYGDGLGNGDGPGHFSEYDWQHVENIRADLLNYNYTTVYQDYPGVSGYSSSASTLSQHINNGVSIINYCNHGSETSWALNNYSNSNVNALTNVNRLPIVWSVACLNGKYNHSQPCFGETWLRANNNSATQPTGAIGGMFSYISQPWEPPQYGQDEMVDVLVESNSNNIKRTLGGCSYDGNMKILDQYGSSNNSAKGTYLAWILFGDPTLTLRNAVPQDMGVTHAPSMPTTATSFTVNATNGEGALATLTRNNEIMGSATINNGTCNITFAAPGTTGTATLTVFGYNKITYIATINIVAGTQNYTVTVSANPTEGGNVTGGGTFTSGQSCTVSATPNANYTFTNWTEGGNVVSTNASYTFNVTANRNLVANFTYVAPTYTINVLANPTAGGNVTGGGTFQEGDPCTVNATVNPGYTFTNWTEGGNVVSTDAEYTFTVNGDRTLTANFTINSYTINVSANPTNGGNVTGGGTFNYGQSCTVNATAATGYTFTNWTEGNTVISTNPSYTFEVTASRNLVANFTANTYTINVSANPTNGGNVTGGGNFNYGQSCTVTASANANYTFTNWTEGNTVVSTNPSYTFEVTANRTLVANFTYVPPTYTINVSANPTNGGNVTGGGSFQQGQSCTVVATPAANYTFTNWTENGNVVSTNASYTFTVNANRTLVAHFTYVPPTYTISVTANPTIGGNVTGGGTYQQGQSCTVVATPAANYNFTNWTENGNVVSTSASYNFTVTGNRTLVANFTYVPPTYTITVVANPTESGNVSGGGTYQEGQSCTVTAEANEGHSFTNWTENGNVVSTSAEYTFNVTGSRTLTANFVPQTVKITTSIDPTDGAIVTGDGTYNYGDEVTLTVIPNEDYHFLNWTEDGEVVSEELSFSFIATSNRTFVAHLEYTEGFVENNINAVVYPNPTKGKVTVESEGLSHIRIVNTYGQTVYNTDLEGDQAIINLSQMAKGIYMMHIEANGGQVVRKIVVE